jgi:hypothetical protein
MKKSRLVEGGEKQRRLSARNIISNRTGIRTVYNKVLCK